MGPCRGPAWREAQCRSGPSRISLHDRRLTAWRGSRGPAVKVLETAIRGMLIIEPRVLGDSRGFFLELFQEQRYTQSGIGHRFVQDNLSRSAQGVLRGLHFQNPKPQGKLVTVLRGCVLDVTVDVRAGSPTFGRHVAGELDEEKRRPV